MALHADPKAGAKQTDKRADFSLRLAGGLVELVDTTFIHAGVKRFKTAASVAGTAARPRREGQVLRQALVAAPGRVPRRCKL